MSETMAVTDKQELCQQKPAAAGMVQAWVAQKLFKLYILRVVTMSDFCAEDPDSARTKTFQMSLTYALCWELTWNIWKYT